MNSLRNKLSNRKLMQNGLIHLQQSYSSSAPSSNIQIPMRKERGPTDILKALESTIRRDPTAPHYKYIDDPFLIPVSNIDKRQFALSREAGKKAAMWIRKEHPDLFQHKHAEPMIECFAPPAAHTDKSQVSEEMLLNIIKSANVQDSLEIYNLLEGNVKIETKLALFEMLCFTNSIQLVDEELLEERWFSSSRQSGWDASQIWKDTRETEDLFKQLVDAGGDVATAAYNSLICGYAKYKNLFKAWELYEECIEKNIPIYKMTYDNLIPIIAVLRKADDDRMRMLVQIYKEMVAKNLKPDIKTLNSSLSIASLMERNKKKNNFLIIFNEFRKMNIKPSLTSYYYYLQCFVEKESTDEIVLNEVLGFLENEELKLQDPRDLDFFVYAMEVARNCNSLLAGKRLHELLLKSENYIFIGNSYQENVYYRYYMLLHLNTLDFESFMKIYLEYTPNLYSPESTVFSQILNTFKDQNADYGREMLPTLFSQVVLYDFIRNEDILGKILELMCVHFKPPSDSPLNKVFAENAWSAWIQLQELKAFSRRGITFAADILEKMAILCIRDNEFDHMLEILSTLINEKNQVLGSISPNSMNEFFDACLSRGHNEACLSLIEYAIEYGMEEGVMMGRKAYFTLSLSVAQENRLQTLVGKDNIKKNPSADQS